MIVSCVGQTSQKPDLALLVCWKEGKLIGRKSFDTVEQAQKAKAKYDLDGHYQAKPRSSSWLGVTWYMSGDGLLQRRP